MKEIGIALFSDAPKTDVKIPIRNPIAINIPWIIEFSAG